MKDLRTVLEQKGNNNCNNTTIGTAVVTKAGIFYKIEKKIMTISDDNDCDKTDDDQCSLIIMMMKMVAVMMMVMTVIMAISDY